MLKDEMKKQVLFIVFFRFLFSLLHLDMYELLISIS